MKKFGLIGLIIIGVFVALSLWGKHKLGDVYTSQQGEFSIQPPKGWQQKGPSGIMKVVFEDSTVKDGPQPRISVMSENSNSDMESYRTYAKWNLEGAARGARFTLHEEKFLEVDGKKAFLIVWSVSPPFARMMKTMQVSIDGGATKWVVTCGTTGEDFDSYRSLFEKSAMTFRILK